MANYGEKEERREGGDCERLREITREKRERENATTEYKHEEGPRRGINMIDNQSITYAAQLVSMVNSRLKIFVSFAPNPLRPPVTFFWPSSKLLPERR